MASSSSADPRPPADSPETARGTVHPFQDNGQLREECFLEIRRRYRRRCGYNLLYADPEGNLLYGMPDCLQLPCRLVCRDCRRETVERAIHGGAPEVCLCADQFALWAVPVMLNQEVRGALIVVGVPLAEEREPGRGPPARSAPFDEACRTLLDLAVEFNLTNRFYLREHQAVRPHPEAGPAEPPSLVTTLSFRSLKGPLEEEEARLAQAVLHPDPVHAGHALEAIIDLLQSVPDLPLPVLRGYATHLVALIHHTAETASGRFGLILEHCYSRTARLYTGRQPEDVFTELRQSLETLLELVSRNQHGENGSPLARALSHMETHFHEHITRADVARAAGISESHFSRLLRERIGRSFPEVLNRYRVDRAAQLLRRTQDNLLTIALEVGFSDQSYFGRVFRRFYGQTPDQYRQQRDGD